MKIVCDFETIKAELAKIEESIATMDSAIKEYSTSVSQSLSSWKGIAKEAFDVTNTDQVDKTKTHVSDMSAVVAFVKDAVAKIEDLEGQLAGLNI